MKHVSIYVPSLRGGGAERVMVTLANGFSLHGLHVDLVLARAEGPYLDEVQPAVRVIDLDSAGVLPSLPKLVKYLRQERPAALVSTLDHANVAALWARRMAGVPTRVVIRVPSNISISSRNAAGLKSRMMPYVVRHFYDWADAVVAVSQGAADDLVRVTGISGDKVHVIYNPTITEAMLTQSREEVDHPWFAPGERPVVLAVGRLVQAKDYFTLIRAFAMVVREQPARLLILGEGKERSRLEKLILDLNLSADVELPGFVANPFKFMARADLFVLSSRWEGLPNALVQALALQIPVVSTDCKSGPREILHDGKYGSLTAVGDSAGLARAIISTLKVRPAKAPPEATAPFLSDRVCSQYMKLLVTS